MKDEKIKILLAEDDANLGILLKEYLESNNFIVELAVDGKEGLDKFSKGKFEVCILDVMMPFMDGFALAKEIKVKNSNIPIIFLTAKSLKEDAIEGFKIGADDYVTKPFNSEELLLRIKAILRRSNENHSIIDSPQNNFSLGNYTFDFQHQVLEINGKPQKLTTREAQLLKLLCINSNEVLDRNFALKTIWNDDNYFNGRSMDVYITKLRKFLKEDPRIEIVNVHGKGFKLLSPAKN